MNTKAPRVPAELQAAGKALWRRLTADFVLEPAEVVLLGLACRQADALSDVEAAVERDGVMVTGAAGQQRLNAAVTECRQARLALATLVGRIALPAEDDRPMTAASERASRAARARWENTPSTTDRPWKGTRSGAA